MSNKKTNIDWEKKLASIIEKSNQNLTELTSEYNRVKSQRPATYERPVSHLPAPVEHPQPIKEFRCVEKKIEGPHEKAALHAFKTTITRPVARSYEDDIMRRIETWTRHCVESTMDEKLTSTSRAIDALRDQIYAVAEEVRELHNQTSRTTMTISSCDRRIDAICHDRKSIEAHLADEISSIKDLFSQSIEQGMSTTVSPIELKSAIETAELNTKMMISGALAPLRTSFRTELSSALKELASVKASLEGFVDEKTATIEAKLLKSQTSLVKMENDAVTKKCLGVLESNVDRFAETLKRNADERAASQHKETMSTVKHLVGLSVEEIERNLTDQLTEKLEEKANELRYQSAPKSNTPTATKEEIETLQQAVATLKNENRNVKRGLKELEERISSVESSHKKNNSDILSIFDSVSRHKTLIENKLVTRDELQNIKEQVNKHAEQVSSMKYEHESALAELARDWSEKFSSLDENISNVQSFKACIPDFTYLDARIEEIETANFKGTLDKILNVVESFEQRMQAIENASKSKESPFASKDSRHISKVELGKLINRIEDRSKAEINVRSARIHAIEMQESNRPFHMSNAHEGDIFNEGGVNRSTRTEDFCDSLGEAIANLHSTLSYAKEIGCSNTKAESNAAILPTFESQRQAEMAEKDCHFTPVKLPAPDPTKLEDMKSPCVHLMGLSSPCSCDTRSTSRPQQLNTTQLATHEMEGPVQVVKCFNGLEEEPIIPRQETPSKRFRSTETHDAVSLCNVLTDDTIECSVIAEINSLVLDSRSTSSSNPTSVELVRTRDDNSLSQLSKSYDANASSAIDVPLKEFSNVLKGGWNPQIISSSYANQFDDIVDQSRLENGDSSPISRCCNAPGESDTPAQDDVMSIPGSLTSFDEIENISNFLSDSKTRSSVSRNPTRHTNTTPYEGWDNLLTELCTSGRILKDSDGGDSATAPEEKLVGMDTGDENECSVSYGSSFDSEGEF
ncbi:hypothetical protein ACHAW6_015125 [Cyclotella cf. meneghiniana]